MGDEIQICSKYMSNEVKAQKLREFILETMENK